MTETRTDGSGPHGGGIHQYLKEDSVYSIVIERAIHEGYPGWHAVVTARRGEEGNVEKLLDVTVTALPLAEIAGVIASDR